MARVRSPGKNQSEEALMAKHFSFRLYLVDINCLAYLLFSEILVVFFHQKGSPWLSQALIHSAWMAAILIFIYLESKYPENKWLNFLRIFYPIAVLLFAWINLNSLFPLTGIKFHATSFIIRLDRLIFGVHPTIWFQQFYRPWLDELMSFFYCVYYLFIPLVSLTLYCRGKKEAARASFSLATLAYFSNFVLFFLIPVLAPDKVATLQEMKRADYSGYFFSWLNRSIQAKAGVTGAAFPSSHIAGALIWVLMALKYQRKLGYVLLPCLAGVCLSTVYLGYHHAVDPIFGLLWGALCYWLGWKILRARGEAPNF